jgi:hypothetical protein
MRSIGVTNAMGKILLNIMADHWDASVRFLLSQKAALKKAASKDSFEKDGSMQIGGRKKDLTPDEVVTLYVKELYKQSKDLTLCESVEDVETVEEALSETNTEFGIKLASVVSDKAEQTKLYTQFKVAYLAVGKLCDARRENIKNSTDDYTPVEAEEEEEESAPVASAPKSAPVVAPIVEEDDYDEEEESAPVAPAPKPTSLTNRSTVIPKPKPVAAPIVDVDDEDVPASEDDLDDLDDMFGDDTPVAKKGASRGAKIVDVGDDSDDFDDFGSGFDDLDIDSLGVSGESEDD